MRAWLTTASGGDCQTLDVCALFEEKAPPRDPPDGEAEISHLSHVAPSPRD
jgi:hypothetical protein